MIGSSPTDCVSNSDNATAGAAVAPCEAEESRSTQSPSSSSCTRDKIPTLKSFLASPREDLLCPEKGVQCRNEVKVFFSIVHVNSVHPICSSAHLDSFSAYSSPSRPKELNASTCVCGGASPNVCGASREAFIRALVPTGFNQAPIPARLLRPTRSNEEGSPSLLPCSPRVSSPSGATIPWNLTYEAIRADDGTASGFRLTVTCELLVVVRQERDTQHRPTGVTLTLLTPPCGVYLRFFLHHAEILLRLLRRLVSFAYQAVPLFYYHFSRSETRSIDRRLLNASAALEKEKVTRKMWRELQRDVKASLSVTRPVYGVSSGGVRGSDPWLPLRQSWRSATDSDLCTASGVYAALQYLLSSDPEYTSAAVAGMLGCSDFSSLKQSLYPSRLSGAPERNTLPSTAFSDFTMALALPTSAGPDFSPARRRARVMIFSLHLAKAEALLSLAAFFVHPPGMPRQAVAHSSREAGGTDTTAFENAYGAMNASVYVNRDGVALPVDSGLPVQWIPMMHSKEREERLLSAYTDDTEVLVLCPEIALCTRLTVKRRTQLSPVDVEHGSKPQLLQFPFSHNLVVEQFVLQDELLSAVLRAAVQACKVNPNETFAVLDALVRWLWHSAVLTTLSRSSIRSLFPGLTSSLEAELFDEKHAKSRSWMSGVLQLFFGHPKTSHSIPPLSEQLRRFLLE